jgi:hypothetical protein
MWRGTVSFPRFESEMGWLIKKKCGGGEMFSSRAGNGGESLLFGFRT